MRLVTSNGYIYYFHGREVGFTRRFGIMGLPRYREVGFTDGLSSLVLPQHFPMLVIVRRGVPRFGMDTWYGTSLVYMVWYIVGV